jgi:hypothetical protein
VTDSKGITFLGFAMVISFSQSGVAIYRVICCTKKLKTQILSPPFLKGGRGD